MVYIYDKLYSQKHMQLNQTMNQRLPPLVMVAVLLSGSLGDCFDCWDLWKSWNFWNCWICLNFWKFLKCRNFSNCWNF